VSPALSDLQVRKVIRALESVGFSYVRTKGSHAVYRRPDGRVAEEWAPSRTSTQQVADRTARYGTWLPTATAEGTGRVWVGTPLRVHRRCDRPMFDISNRIAYDGLMVFGTAERDPFHGRNIWWDVRSAEARGHWIPAEGQALRTMLERLRQNHVPVSQIRVVSPFRDVIEEAESIHRDVFRDSGVLPVGRETWGAARYFEVLAASVDPWPPPEHEGLASIHRLIPVARFLLDSCARSFGS
jgi:hypothetical protein